MLTENTFITIDNIDVTNKTISLVKDTVVYRDGIEIARERHRCAYAPGDIEELKVALGTTKSPEIDYLKGVWTPEVISEYRAKVQLLKDNINP